MGETGERVCFYAPEEDGQKWRAPIRQGNKTIGFVFGDSYRQCEDRGMHWERSIAACASMPQPEQDVRELHEMVVRLANAIDEVGLAVPYGGLLEEKIAVATHVELEARALLARINPEPAQ